MDQPPGSPQDSPKRSDERTNATRIATAISRLLAHYWAANEDARLRTALAEDWLADLREFDCDIVEAACTEWRRDQTKRPMIADIRKLCREHQRARTPTQPKLTAEEIAREKASRVEAARWHAAQETRYADAFAWRQRFAESRGFPDFTAVMAYGITAAYKLPCRDGYADPLLERMPT